MTVKVRNLYESLEKKLNESNEVSLTEAFNDSFPDWLKKRLVQVRQFHGQPKSSGSNDADPMNVPRENRPTYASPRGFYGNDRELGLFDSLLKGTDIQKLEVHEGELPTKRTDPRLKEPNIPVWGFPNGQVYIPGFNDNEEFTRSDGKRAAFKYIPAKFLLSDASHFAYIDGSTLPESTYLDIQNQRRLTASELKDLNYGRMNKDPEQFVQNVPSGWGLPKNIQASRDKSGYVVNPRKFYDKLAEAKAEKYGEELQKYHDMLVEYRDDITSAMGYYDPFEQKDEYRQLSDLLRTLMNAIDYYNSMAEDIEDLANKMNPKDPNDYYKKMIVRRVQDLQNNRYIKELEKGGNDIFLGSADWLV